MWRLGIDTSGPTAFVAIAGPGGAIERSRACAGAQSEELSVLVEETLAAIGIQAATVGEVCIGLGPGSFTGLRIGLAFAKGFAQARGVPLIGASSLAAYTYTASGMAERVVALSDAGRGELFWCVFQGREGWHRLRTDALAACAVVQRWITELASGGNVIVVGEGSTALLPPPIPPTRVAAGVLALCAHGSSEAVRGDLSELQPNYLRAVSARTVAERQAGQS